MTPYLAKLVNILAISGNRDKILGASSPASKVAAPGHCTAEKGGGPIVIITGTTKTRRGVRG